MRSLRIINRSSHRTLRVAEAVDAIDAAIAIQLHDVAQIWGPHILQIVHDANDQGFEIVLLDDTDAADALGYHDLAPNGVPYARVFVQTILDNGGTWLRGPDSVAATVSHEACELVGDPTANHWVETDRGALVAVELCDPVESSSYSVNLRGRRRVSVSNFVYPDWFNPYAPPGTQLDHLRVVRRPFQSAPDGYVIHRTRAGVRNVWGTSYPRWRQAGKRRAGSRTHVRHQLG